jgi:hypothetical protein
MSADVDWESLMSIRDALEDLRRQDVDSVINSHVQRVIRPAEPRPPVFTMGSAVGGLS